MTTTSTNDNIPWINKKASITKKSLPQNQNQNNVISIDLSSSSDDNDDSNIQWNTIIRKKVTQKNIPTSSATATSGSGGGGGSSTNFITPVSSIGRPTKAISKPVTTRSKKVYSGPKKYLDPDEQGWFKKK